MYQVYHKDSSATSVKAWGYPHLKNSGTSEELGILDDLSDLIDEARETNDQEERKELYEEAMGYILDLAVEILHLFPQLLYPQDCIFLVLPPGFHGMEGLTDLCQVLLQVCQSLL